ncbi:Lrp/AsnC family transcriptional regulator [Streptomyces sp. NPDC051322]|uniref:Lrp/AsnC family transcriptional regulator n=1 Tax=Streptomyces sp. NPDC051322 TaxID=3154645 RepID=UPI00344D32CD
MPLSAVTSPESGTEVRLSPRSAGLSETDLTLIEALQVQPRASWTRVAEVIGIDATTAARRWQQLTRHGLAWMTAYPTHHCATVGYADLACRPDALDGLTEQLRRWPYVFSVERTSGDHQLFLGLAARDLPALDALITRRLGQLDGVRSLRLSIGTRVYHEGSGWLIHALNGRQRSFLAGDGRAVQSAPTGPRESDRQLLFALSADARLSYAELARECGLSETTVRRRLHRMTSSGELHFRCDVTQLLVGWPVGVTYRLRVPAHLLDSTALALAALPQTRLCVAVTGSHNLLLSVWLRSTADCRAMEAQILDCCARIDIAQSDVTLYAAKRMGRLLNPEGRAIGHVTMTAWPRDVTSTVGTEPVR